MAWHAGGGAGDAPNRHPLFQRSTPSNLPLTQGERRTNSDGIASRSIPKESPSRLSDLLSLNLVHQYHAHESESSPILILANEGGRMAGCPRSEGSSLPRRPLCPAGIYIDAIRESLSNESQMQSDKIGHCCRF